MARKSTLDPLKIEEIDTLAAIIAAQRKIRLIPGDRWAADHFNGAIMYPRLAILQMPSHEARGHLWRTIEHLVNSHGDVEPYSVAVDACLAVRDALGVNSVHPKWVMPLFFHAERERATELARGHGKNIETRALPRRGVDYRTKELPEVLKTLHQPANNEATFWKIVAAAFELLLEGTISEKALPGTLKWDAAIIDGIRGLLKAPTYDELLYGVEKLVLPIATQRLRDLEEQKKAEKPEKPEKSESSEKPEDAPESPEDQDESEDSDESDEQSDESDSDEEDEERDDEESPADEPDSEDDVDAQPIDDDADDRESETDGDEDGDDADGERDADDGESAETDADPDGEESEDSDATEDGEEPVPSPADDGDEEQADKPEIDPETQDEIEKEVGGEDDAPTKPDFVNDNPNAPSEAAAEQEFDADNIEHERPETTLKPAWGAVARSASRLINTVRQTFLTYLEENEVGEMVYGTRSGRLDVPIAIRPGASQSRRPFKRRTQPNDRSYGIGVIVDCSGSMGCRTEGTAYPEAFGPGPITRWHLATRMTVALTEALSRLPGSDVCITAYHTPVDLVKSLRQPMDAVRKQHIMDHMGAYRDNSDAEALKTTIDELAKSEAECKLIFHLTDGQFCSRVDMVRKEIARAASLGIQVVILTLDLEPDFAYAFVPQHMADEINEENVGKVLAKHLQRMLAAA